MNSESTKTNGQSRRLWLGVLSLAVVVGLAVVGVLVWPTRYRYDHMNVRGSIFPVRVDRITGTTQILYPSGWIEVGARESAEDLPIPSRELEKLTGNGSFSGQYLFLDVYNSSSWRVRELTITLTITGSDGKQVASRQYRIARTEYLSPLTSGSYSTDVGLRLQKDQQWSWYIVSAKGLPE